MEGENVQMSAKTKLDRVLEALAPALTAELDHVVQETREALEKEFEGRLQNATKEAEAAANAAQAFREQAVAEAKEEARKQVTSELEEQLNKKLESAAAELKKEAAEERAKADAALEQAKKEWAAERAKLQEELEQWRTFADAQRQLAEASSQPEILLRFLKLTQPFAESLAVYVTKADGLALWKKRGKGAFPEIVSKQTTDPDSYFRVISVRGKTIGAVCATPTFKKDALNFLAGSLENAIELFGSKLKIASKPAAS